MKFFNLIVIKVEHLENAVQKLNNSEKKKEFEDLIDEIKQKNLIQNRSIHFLLQPFNQPFNINGGRRLDRNSENRNDNRNSNKKQMENNNNRKSVF